MSFKKRIVIWDLLMMVFKNIVEKNHGLSSISKAAIGL
jgi:hypothetical protein